jgi:hypothetical protein
MDKQTKSRIQKIISTIDELANAKPVMRDEDFNLLKLMTDEPEKLAAYFEEHPELGYIFFTDKSYIEVVCSRIELNNLKNAYHTTDKESPLLFVYDAKHHSDFAASLAISPYLR